MTISFSALDFAEEIAKRTAAREAITRDTLTAMVLLLRRAGGVVEISKAELEDCPSLAGLAILSATSVETGAVTIRLIEGPVMKI